MPRDGVPAKGYGSWRQYRRRWRDANDAILGVSCRACLASLDCIDGCADESADWTEQNGLGNLSVRGTLDEAGRILAGQA